MTDKKTNDFEKKPKQRHWIVRLLSIVILGVFIIGLGVIVVGKVTYENWKNRALSEVVGKVQVTSLKTDVTINRDKWGVPYIVAGNMADVAFAQGYATAQDRLWQMDLLRRAARGELSAVLGAGEKDATLEVDRLHRSLGLRRAAERDFPGLSEDLKQMLTAYSEGVNAYITAHQDRLPFEFKMLRYKPEPWQAVDSLAIGKLMALSLTGTWKFDLMRAELKEKLDEKVYKMLFDDSSDFSQPIFDLPAKIEEKPQENLEKPKKIQAQTAKNSYPKIETEIFAATKRTDNALSDLVLSSNEAMIGSNNWVISGKLTDTGKPLLANDPHQGLSLPAIWYQINLRATDGSYYAAGVSVIGAPGVVIGHNDHIAWGATNVMADVQDVYIEEFDPTNPTRYRIGEEWKEAEIIKEQIQVRESLASSKTKTIEHEIVITRHGPIVASSKGQKIALCWTGRDAPSEFPVTYKLNQAKNWQEFCDALRGGAMPIINYVYADKEGNIGYYAAGRIPIRANGKGDLPFDGRTNEGEWTGYIPFEEMPHLYNPENGYIATANQRLVGEKYPYRMTSDWAPPYRAHRIYKLLAEKKQFTFADMHKLHGDVYAIPTKFFADQVVKRAAEHKNDPIWQQMEKDLNNWDGNLAINSRSAAIAVTMRNAFTEDFFTSWLGDLRPTYNWYLRSSVIDHVIANWSADFLPTKYKDFDTMLIEAYKSATKNLTEKLGSDSTKWTYGGINKFSFNHPLAKISVLKTIFNSSDVIVGGSAHTINCNDTNADRIWGPSMRMVISLDDWDLTTLAVTPGASGQLGSPHYLDQIDDWASLQPHGFPFSEKNVEKFSVAKLTLVAQKN